MTEQQPTEGLSEQDRRDLDLFFTYHPPTAETIPKFKAIRDAAYQMGETIMANVPPSPDRTVAIRHLRDAVASANASLACYPEGMPPR